MNQYPITPESNKLSYDHFLVNFEGKDKKLSKEDEQICVDNENELIDLRPYMIE